MFLLKPTGRGRRLPLGLHQAVEHSAKVRIGQGMRQVFARDGLEHHAGVVRERPQRGIEPSPQFVATVIPRPAQVHGQFGQSGKAFRRDGWRGIVGCGCAHCFEFIGVETQLGSP